MLAYRTIQALILILMFSSPLAAHAVKQERRGVSVMPQVVAGSLPITGDYWALIIGIDQYQRVPKLQSAVKDAQAVREVLVQRYGFGRDHVIELINGQATREGIENALYQVRKKTGPNDSVFIYYAGHGQIDQEDQIGYWVPVEGKAQSPGTFISNARIRDEIGRMKAKHVYLVADSCFSGTLFASGRALPPLNDKFFQRLYANKSRWGLTSGMNEPVTDQGKDGHSMFAYFFLKLLKENEDPYLVPSHIYDQIAPLISRNTDQQPVSQPLQNAGDEGGQFVFRLASASGGPLPSAPPRMGEGKAGGGEVSDEMAKMRAELEALKAQMSKPAETQKPIEEARARPYSGPGSLSAEGGPSGYQKACEQGNGRACKALGFLYAVGRGVVKDESRAVALFQRGCDNGERQACRSLARMYVQGRGVPKDAMRAVSILRERCEAGNGGSCEGLGSMYRSGLGVVKDIERSLGLFRQNCRQNETRGCTALGYAYELGRGVEKDEGKAGEFYQDACTGGDEIGCGRLGLLYLKGMGRPKDEDRAIALFRQSCDHGEGHGCTYLGNSYRDGSGVAKDEVRAAALYQKGCDIGWGAGCRNLGLAYEKGTGVPKDLAQAAALYQQACEGLDPGGCTNLGVLYDNGQGVTQDMARAVTLFRQACEEEHPRGCSNLGNSYAGGRGMEKDLARAMEVLQMGCSLGDTWGCDRLKQVQ